MTSADREMESRVHFARKKNECDQTSRRSVRPATSRPRARRRQLFDECEAMRESRAASQYKRSRKQRLHGYACPQAEDEWDVCAETPERPEGHPCACPASQKSDVRKHVP